VKLPVDQALVSAQDTNDLVSLGKGGANDRPYTGVHAWRVAPAAKHPDFHQNTLTFRAKPVLTCPMRQRFLYFVTPVPQISHPIPRGTGPGRRLTPFLEYRGPQPMTIDKSLKIQAGSTKQRNVLTRPERLAKLVANDRFGEDDSLYGMPKVRVTKISLKKKKKAKKDDEEEPKKEGKK
jgi:small basic protein (TIGR04137 family)